MGQLCKVCSHPKRLEIDRMIVSGLSKPEIGRMFGISNDSIRGHAQEHLSRQLVQAFEQKSITQSSELINRIEDLLTKARTIFDRNFEKEKDLVALKALAEQRNTIALIASIAAYLHESRALELQVEQERTKVAADASSKEFISLAFSRLNDKEMDLWIALHERIRGERSEPVVPGKPNRPANKDPRAYDDYVDAEPVEEEEEEEEESEETPVLPYRRTK